MVSTGFVKVAHHIGNVERGARARGDPNIDPNITVTFVMVVDSVEIQLNGLGRYGCREVKHEGFVSAGIIAVDPIISPSTPGRRLNTRPLVLMQIDRACASSGVSCAVSIGQGGQLQLGGYRERFPLVSLRQT
jgi:hypothetical protein